MIMRCLKRFVAREVFHALTIAALSPRPGTSRTSHWLLTLTQS